MSAFTDLIAKSHARWTTLAEFGLGLEQSMFPNYTAGIWQAMLAMDWSNLPVLCGFNMPVGDSATGAPTVPAVDTVKAGTEFLTEQASLANCISTNKSWYMDISTSTLYVHCNLYNDPDIYVMILGTTFYASDRAIDLDGHYWEPCIVGVPTIEVSRDPLLYGLMAFDGGRITLDNHGGRYDTFKDYLLYGQPVTVKFGGDDLAYADYRTCFKGFVRNVTLGEEQIQIEVIDKRAELNVSLPVSRFTKAAYPDLRDRDVGKYIPLAWGVCKNIECVCTNENAAAPANYTFKIADVANHSGGIRGISAAYVNGESKTIASYDLIAGTFNIASANYAPGRKTTADVTGYGTKNLITRADCENNTAPVILDEASVTNNDTTFARSSDYAYANNFSYKIIKTNAAGVAAACRLQDNLSSSDMHGLSANAVYTFSAYVYVPTASGISLNEVTVGIGAYAAGNWTITQSNNPASFDTWHRLIATHTMSASATGTVIDVRLFTTAAINEYYYVDNIQLEHGNNNTAWILREDRTVTKSLDVIEDIVNTYSPVAYNNTYFDTTEWAAAKTSDYTIGLFIDDDKLISEIIAVIAQTNAANFIVKDSGLYTWKKFVDGTAEWTAGVEEVEGEVTSDQDYENYLTSVDIRYNKDWDENGGPVESNTDYESTVYQKYGQYKTHEIDSLLTSEADAESLAAWLMNYMKDARQIIENTLPVKYIETEIGDVVALNGDRPTRGWMGAVKCEVIGIRRELGENPKVTITGREVPNVA